MYKTILITILFYSLNFCNAQNAKIKIVISQDKPTGNKNYIFYNDSLKLTWNDFKAKPDTQNPYQAITHAGMQMSYASTTRNDSTIVLINTYCHFDKSKSWHKMPVNDTMLKHELYHFKITAYCYYTFLQELEKLSSLSEKELMQRVMDLFRTYQNKAIEIQKLYDDETEHSVNYELQASWQTKIDAWLKEFEK